MKIPNANKIVQTIVSFGELLDDEVTHADLPQNLIDSISGNYPDEIKGVDLRVLGSNLFSIFENSKNLKLTLKGQTLLLDNENIYLKGLIVSDIRLIFDKNITDSNRNGVIVHKLHISVRSNNKTKNIFIALDSSDLKQLKEIVERAMLKEDLIKEDYENINFIIN